MVAHIDIKADSDSGFVPCSEAWTPIRPVVQRILWASEAVALTLVAHAISESRCTETLNKIAKALRRRDERASDSSLEEAFEKAGLDSLFPVFG